MRAETRYRLAQQGKPPRSQETRRPNESRRAKRRRIKRMLPVYQPLGGNSGSNIKADQQYTKNIWPGTAAWEG